MPPNTFLQKNAPLFIFCPEPCLQRPFRGQKCPPRGLPPPKQIPGYAYSFYYFLTKMAYTVWVKKSPPQFFLTFSPNGWEFLVQILHTYSTFLSTLEYKFLFNYLQLWRSYAILSAITIIYSKCPPSVEMHAGWSHLIWHNFVAVRDNWMKICSLA